MCGIVGIFGNHCQPEDLKAMLSVQRHRGPDGEGHYFDPDSMAALGHNRLSIIDLSQAGSQPMTSADGNLVLVLNGEIYNYLELKRELECEYDFRTRSDTEVLLAAYQKWGKDCLDRLIGMFAFIVWDEREKTAFAARDRFGVKPLYYHRKNDGSLMIASEIKALHAGGVHRSAKQETWATYLTYGLYDHSADTFWKDIYALPGGHFLTWSGGRTILQKWYDIADRVGVGYDRRSQSEVCDEYFELMKESVRFRFRSDVPVGINLSGGLDSSCLLGLVQEVQGEDSDVMAFTFTTGDVNYDELPWVGQMIAKTSHPLIVSELNANEVPDLAESVGYHQDEPFGGIPTLAYAKLFEAAKDRGVTVLLDGNGMDEQWAGYDYYQSALDGTQPGLIQGTKESPIRSGCLTPAFRALAEPLQIPSVFADKLRNIQFRDAALTKIPRAMRFNDRISMRSSTELREPFLDHRLMEIAFRQPPERKIENGIHKKMLREIAGTYLPRSLSESPKRSMQTPQREWLRGPLREWAAAQIEAALSGPQSSYFDRSMVRDEAAAFFGGAFDNSFFVWQWVSLGLMQDRSMTINN